MILVDVYIPSVDDNFDFMLDEDTEIRKIIMEINEMISKKMKSHRIDNVNDFLLYSMEQEQMLDKEQTLYESGIRDGSRLMLV